MKRVKMMGIIALMGVFALMSMGSGSSETSTSQKEIVTESSDVASVETPQDEGIVAEDSINGSNTGSKPEAITIEEQVLIESGDIKITALSYEVDSIWGDGIKLLIENNGTKDYRSSGSDQTLPSKRRRRLQVHRIYRRQNCKA